MSSHGVESQYSEFPYPAVPLDAPVFPTAGTEYSSFLGNAFYQRDQAIPLGKLRVLDAGCGTGLQAVRLARANPDAVVLGIDPSGAALEVCQRRIVRHGVQNLRWRQASIQEVAAEGREFDFINCADVLYLLEDPLKSICMLSSVLSPNGIIRFSVH